MVSSLLLLFCVVHLRTQATDQLIRFSVRYMFIPLSCAGRKQGGQAVKNGKPAAGAAAGYAPLSAQSDHLPPPIYQPKNEAAAPARNRSPAPSEEPSLINQSGHADLAGAGFKPASLPSRYSSCTVCSKFHYVR